MKIFDQVQTSRLPNGFTVVTDYRPQSRVLYPQIVVYAGGCHDAPELLGTAHFLEHMWCYAHPHLKEADYRAFLRSSGLNNNTNFVTSRETTTAYSSGSPEKIREWMDISGDMLGQMTFMREDVASERGPIYQEVKGRLAGRSDQQDIQQFRGMYGNQKIAQLFGGHPDHLAIIKYEDLKKFYHRYYTGANMALIVSGPATHADNMAYADAKFAHLPEGVREPRLKMQFQPTDVIQPEPEKMGAELSIHIRYDVAKFCGGREGDVAVLAQHLSQTLYEELRIKRGLVYSAGCGYSSTGAKGLVLGTGANIAPSNVGTFFDAASELIASAMSDLTTARFKEVSDILMASQQERLAHTYESANSRGDYIKDSLHDFGRIVEPYERLEERRQKSSLEGVREVYESVLPVQVPSMLYRGDTVSAPLPSGAEVAHKLGLRKQAGPDQANLRQLRA